MLKWVESGGKEEDEIFDAHLIINRIYLGSYLAATAKKNLKENNITHILSLTAEYQPPFPEEFTYLHVKASDFKDQNLIETFPVCFQFIDQVLSSSSGNVLIHCAAGISRSSSIMIGYIMKTQGKQYHLSFGKLRRMTLFNDYCAIYKDAHEFVKSKRSCISPNSNFVKQLQLYASSGFDLEAAEVQEYMKWLVRPLITVWKSGKPVDYVTLKNKPDYIVSQTEPSKE